MKHWKYLDVARGIGLLLVIISHSCGLSPYLINYYIPLFFVVSGYLYKPGRSYGENVVHKAKRLLVPYLATARCCWCSTGQPTYLAGDGKICTRSAVLTLLPF